jgi:DNA-binding transcriptional LysR family regulator
MKPVAVSLRQLEYFVAAAEAGQMSAAAARFPVSQSAVSVAIAQLERTLGVQLFHRRKARGLSLTPAGTELFTDARRLLEHAVELEASAQTIGQEISGLLKIGCFPTLTPFYMPRVLDAFAQGQQLRVFDFL